MYSVESSPGGAPGLWEPYWLFSCGYGTSPMKIGAFVPLSPRKER